jgi:hypothetical protein
MSRTIKLQSRLVGKTYEAVQYLENIMQHNDIRLDIRKCPVCNVAFNIRSSAGDLYLNLSCICVPDVCLLKLPWDFLEKFLLDNRNLLQKVRYVNEPQEKEATIL